MGIEASKRQFEHSQFAALASLSRFDVALDHFEESRVTVPKTKPIFIDLPIGWLMSFLLE